MVTESRFARFALKSDTLPEQKRKNFGDSPYFAIGLFDDVIITDIEYKGLIAKDDTWLGYQVTFSKGIKSIKHFIMVPTKKFLFGSTQTEMPYRKLEQFVTSLGFKLNNDNACLILPALFADHRVLIGLKANIVVAAQDAHVVKEGEAFIIRDAKDKPILSDDLVNPLSFPDVDSAKAYGASVNLKITPFKCVRYVNRPKTPNAATLLAEILEGKKAEEVVEEQESSCPF